jgi:2,3-bisphosphoglycerate-dependent phosphoglycerate mutase
MKPQPIEPTPPNRSARFLLIRHGESEANAGLPTPSPSAICLTEKGQGQAAALAERLEIVPALIIVSPYLRTRQTAEPFMQKHPGTPVEVWPVHEFTYLDIGRHANTTETERSQFVEAYWNRNDPQGNEGGGAESFAEFIRRVDTMVARLRGQESGPVVVFTHGYFIHGVEMRLANPNRPVDEALMKSFHETWPENAPAHCEVRELR